MHTLFQAHCFVRFDGPILGYLYEMMERKQDAFELCFAKTNVLYVDTWKRLKEFKIISFIHAILNPIYMRSEKFKENEEMKNGINHIQEHLVAGEEKEEDFKNEELYHMKDSNVFTVEVILMLKTSS